MENERPARRHGNRSNQALDFYLTGLLAKYQKWLVESPAKMEIRLDNTGSTMKEMIARQVMDGCREGLLLVLVKKRGGWSRGRRLKLS